MKNFIKKTLIAIGICLMIVGCGCFKKTQQGEQILGTSMRDTTMIASTWQVDSICTADSLPDFETWYKSSFKDFETGETTTKRYYIKTIKGGEIVYIIVGKKEPYEVSKRITTE